MRQITFRENLLKMTDGKKNQKDLQNKNYEANMSCNHKSSSKILPAIHLI